MQTLLHLQWLVIGCALLQYSIASHAECVAYHKRAPVRAVCGRVFNGAGEWLNNVEVTLTGEAGSVLFTTRSDSQGSFSFRSTPKGDYTLHAKAPGYKVAEREIRVTQSNEEKCSPKNHVTLGFGFECDTSSFVKGVDKPSDLDSEFRK